MKNLFIIILLSTCMSVNAQKKGNVFATAEILRQTGASLFYNHKLKDSKLGLGGGVQIVNFKVSNSYSPMVEVRYFLPVERSAFIPHIQIGKNFARYDFVNASNMAAQSRGGLQLNANLGFSLGMFTNHDGPYVSAGIRFIEYRHFTNNVKYDSRVTKDFLVSVGFRF